MTKMLPKIIREHVFTENDKIYNTINILSEYSFVMRITME